MDLKVKVEEIVTKIKKDKNLGKKFEKNPAETINEILGVKLPKEKVEPIVEAVKSKLKLEKVTGILKR